MILFFQAYVFGGCNFWGPAGVLIGFTDEMFTLDIPTLTWTAVPPQVGRPSARCNHAAVATSTGMILFGGQTSLSYSDETFIYSFAAKEFQRVVTETRPPARSSSSAAYNPTTHSVYIYGGTYAGSLGDMWQLTLAPSGDHGSWAQIDVSRFSPGWCRTCQIHSRCCFVILSLLYNDSTSTTQFPGHIEYVGIFEY